MDNDLPRVRRPAKVVSAVGDALRERDKTKIEPEIFRTPDEVAAEQVTEPVLGVNEVATEIIGTSAQPAASQTHRFTLHWHWPPSKKELLASGSVVLLMIVGVTSFTLLHHTNKTVAAAPVIKQAVNKPVPAPTTVPSNLTGLPVAPSINQGPVTGVMIENSDAARPQSGLSQAGVVFEAIAEGGVTRFLALFQDTAPTNIGPIRSARPYYISWDLGFDAAYAHVGGSPDGLADIKSWNVRDLDQFANGGSYHRITTREAPHNVYTGVDTLNQLEAKKGYTTSSYTSFPRKAAAPSATPTAKSINLTLSGPDYNAHYDYDATTNSYKRSEGGAPQMDAATNTQVSPKVVVAMVIPETRGALDASGAYYSNYQTIGSGAATIFQDGTVTTGSWSKPSNTAQISFTDSNGKTIALDPGQTWLTAVLVPSDISYAP